MDELEKIILTLQKNWEKNLKSEGVKFPTGKKLIELACLYSFMPNPISQVDIKKWHEKFNKEYMLQARHLADMGWYIKSGNPRFTRGEYEKKFKSNELSLHSVDLPNPVWRSDSVKRVNNLLDSEWRQILEKFKNRGCAVCGRKMRHYDKGHLSKSKSYNKFNIVPMCVECNNWGQELEFKEYRDLVFRPILKSGK